MLSTCTVTTPRTAPPLLPSSCSPVRNAAWLPSSPLFLYVTRRLAFYRHLCLTRLSVTVDSPAPLPALRPPRKALVAQPTPPALVS